MKKIFLGFLLLGSLAVSAAPQNNEYFIDVMNEDGSRAYKLTCAVNSSRCMKDFGSSRQKRRSVAKPFKVTQNDIMYLGSRTITLSLKEFYKMLRK